MTYRSTLAAVLLLLGPLVGPAAPASAQDAAEEPFLMMVEEVFSVMGVGTIATGTIDRGRVAVGDRVEVIGGNAERTSLVTVIETRGDRRESADAGEFVGLALRGVPRDEIRRGYTVAAEGTLDGHVVIRVRMERLDAPLEPFSPGDERSGRVMASLAPEGFSMERRERWILPEGVETDPTAPFDLILVLSTARAVETGWRVILRDGGVEIGRGTVREIVF